MTVEIQPALARGDKGPAVTELQMRLAGFRGTLPDGDYGPGTELQVMAFQRFYMGTAQPSGAADDATMAAIVQFGAEHPIDFDRLHCPCGQCGGFGQGRFRGQYREGKPYEAYHRYEYPGIHRMLLWTVRAAIFYAKEKNWRLIFTSGYRCAIDNADHNRSSTNHHGKAVDLDIIADAGTDRGRCDALRTVLAERANFQRGWNVANRKSYEPREIAPTWVHIDVRSYAPQYLNDLYFVKNATALDAVP